MRAELPQAVTNPPEQAPGFDILADLQPRTNARFSCRVLDLRRDRPDLAEQYDKAMEAGRFGDRAIATWITDHGFPFGQQVVSRHRRKECLGCRQTS